MKSLLPAVFTALCIAGAPGLGAADVAVTVDAARPRVAVSRELYGIFFEEINHAGEGGLYAEMVLNRDFETVNLPQGATWAGNLLRTKDGWQERKWFGNSLHGWKLVTGEGSSGSMHLDTREPLNARNPHSLRLEALQAGRALGVVNTGFWGMNFAAGKFYDLSFYARTGGADAFDVTVALVSASGREVYASSVIRNVGGAWRQYSCSLRSNATDPEGRLRITVNRPGTLWLDVVSLFPRDTYKNRPNGLRPDLVDMLRELKPAFLRFPGGAIVGGLNLDNRIQWKNSIGDIAQRQGTMNLWGYYTTNGLGFHEYLQLAEDLGADALWVCNPGFSDGYRRSEYAPPEQLDAFVQEALDALEYALGPADSAWGSRRAANGHPAPFPLKYVEIGNEASGKAYQESYTRFYRAIRRRYPNLTIISNVRKVPDAPVDVVDDHRYGTPESFFAAHGHYDKADRNGPKVYVGEYGCNRNVGEGNWLAALSEAAFLLGLERNSDVVKMSSYAPLFFHADDIAWPVNLIGFDSSRAVGRGSWHVQRLFAAHRPDEALSTEVKDPGQEIFALAGVDRRASSLIVKLVSRAAEARTVRVSLAGLAGLGREAEVVTLSHRDPEAENTLGQPRRIVPVTSRRPVPGPEFDYPLPPYSVTVLRIALRP